MALRDAGAPERAESVFVDGVPRGTRPGVTQQHITQQYIKARGYTGSATHLDNATTTLLREFVASLK